MPFMGPDFEINSILFYSIVFLANMFFSIKTCIGIRNAYEIASLALQSTLQQTSGTDHFFFCFVSDPLCLYCHWFFDI